MTHFPLPIEGGLKKTGKYCALCRWATGKKVSAQLSRCESCGIHLCVWCFKPFHTLGDLEAEKETLCAEIERRRASGVGAKRAKK